MVQESRSLFIQQLFQGGFKEDDDDDEDEDAAHDFVMRHPSDDFQGYGRKELIHQEEYEDYEASRPRNKGSKDEATTRKQVMLDFDNRQGSVLREEPESECQGDYLQSEKDIIEEGSKKLLQIHSEFLVRQRNPPSRPTSQEPSHQEPISTPSCSNFFSNNCREGDQGSPPVLAFTPPKYASPRKEHFNDHVGMVLGETPPSYGSVEDALLSTQRDFKSPISPEEEERKQRCFAVLKNAKVLAREVNANISVPVFSRGVSLSGCTESLASDRASSTDSVNGGDETDLQDVTSAEKAFPYDEQKGDQIYQTRSSIDGPATRDEGILQQVENIPDIQLDTPIPEQYPEVEIAGQKIVEFKTPLSHRFEKHHVEFFSKIHEAEPASLIHGGKAEKTDEAESFKFGNAMVDATGGASGLVDEMGSLEKELQQQDVSSYRKCNLEDFRLTESSLKHCADVASISPCRREEIHRKDDPVVAIDSVKDEQSLEDVAAAKAQVIPSRMTSPIENVDSENETVMCMSSEEKLQSPVEISPIEEPAPLAMNVTRQTAESPLPAQLSSSPKAPAKIKRGKLKKKTKASMAQQHHQDARSTMVFVRSDTRTVAYNNGPHFAVPDQEGPQQNAMNGFFGSSQSNPAAAFICHETDGHLMQAQNSAKEAMVAATSALAQSHCEWSRMQTQAVHSRLTAMRESQIAALAASVAAAAVVAKAAVEAARAIQEASREFLGGSSQPSFGNRSGYTRSADTLAQGQGDRAQATHRQSVQITTGDRKRKNKKPAADAKDEQVRDRSGRFSRQEESTDDKKGAVNREQVQVGQKKRIVHAMPRNPEGGVFRCTKGAATVDQPDELVEVMTEEVGLQGGWFVAKILMKTETEAFVQYNELFRDDGCTPCRNLFPLSSYRDEDACGRSQNGDRRWLRPLHPCNKARSMLPQTWTVGNRVDAFSNGGWWEGTIVEIDKANKTNIKIRYPGDKGIQAVKACDVRPSLIWAGDDWRPLKAKSLEEDEPCSKRRKVEVVENEKAKARKEHIIRKEKMKLQSLKKLVSEASCKPRESRRSSEAAAAAAAAHKNCKGAMPTLSTTKRVGFTLPITNQPTTPHRPSRHATSWGCRADSVKKKSACLRPGSLTSSAARKGTMSTRLQRKTEVEKRQNLSKVRKGAKSVSTRSDTMKLNALQTKLLKALKKTSSRKHPRSTLKRS